MRKYSSESVNKLSRSAPLIPNGGEKKKKKKSVQAGFRVWPSLFRFVVLIHRLEKKQKTNTFLQSINLNTNQAQRNSGRHGAARAWELNAP